jgi:SulP family sulfate permease
MLILLPAAVVDGAQHARSVRQDTAELASYVLDRRGSFRGRWADSHRRRSSHGQQQQQQQQQDAGGLDCDVDVGGLYDCEDDDGNAASDGDDSAVTDGWSVHHDAPSVIFETSEPPSPPEVDLVEGPVVEDDESGPSLLASMLRREPSGESVGGRGEAAAAAPLAHRETTEATPLLAAGGQSSGYGSEQQQQQQQHGHFQNGHSGDVESQHKDDQDASKARRRRRGRLGNAAARLRRAGAAATSKDVWNGPTLWENAVLAPARCLPAVAVGLLLNILDGLSYGESRGGSMALY